MAREKQVKRMTVRKCMRSLVLLTLAFVQSFSAYYVLEGLQSSVNPTLGLISLSLIYGFYCLSSMLLPSLVASIFKPHHTLAITQLLYMLYTAANFYPTAWTMIPSAVIMGLSAGPLWATARTYVGDLARVHAKAEDKRESELTGYYFGVFYMFQASQVLGNLLMWLINYLTMTTKTTTTINEMMTTPSTQYNRTATTETVKITSTKAAAAAGLEEIVECGMWYIKTESSLATESAAEEEENRVGINYLALTIFLAMQFASALIFLLLSDVTRLERELDDVSNNNNNSNDDDEDLKSLRMSKEEEEEEAEVKYIEDEFDSIDSSEEASSGAPPYGENLLASMFRLVASDRSCALLLVLTFSSGFLHCTVVGDFTRSWISCSQGVGHVSSLLAVYGCVSTGMSLASGPLLRAVKCPTLIYASTAVSSGLWATLYVWHPTPASPIVSYALVIAGFGVSNGLLRSLLAHIYARFYPDRLSAGMALLGSGEAVSSALLFGLGDWTPPVAKITLSLVFGLLGAATYRSAWKLRDSDDRAWRNSGADDKV